MPAVQPEAGREPAAGGGPAEAGHHGRRAFAAEDIYRLQQSVYQGSTGPDTRELLHQILAGLPRGDLLEVGCGEGGLAARLAAGGWRLTAVDASLRMCELASGAGIRAQVAALPRLPFAAGSFDAVVAAWVLHYLEAQQVVEALREIRRMLRPRGHAVLATNSDRHMAELWSRLPGRRYRLTFSAENAGAMLQTAGMSAEIIPVEGTVTFTSYAQAHAFVANQVQPRSAADRLARFSGPLPVTRRSAVIIAQAIG